VPPAITPTPSRPQEFPTPMNFSFNRIEPKSPTPGPLKPGGRATLDLSLTMRLGETGTTPFARVGSDWGNELIAWVNQRKYYPPQAAMNGEDGEVTVRVVVTPGGHVTSVAVARRSGSSWLDLALESMFRGATLPPLHGETEPFTFHFTMNYILLRGP
jgi:TonB family protein